MLVLLISLSSSPIAEQAVLDAKFDITKLKRITVEDIDMQFDTNFSSLFGLDEFSHMVLKYLFIFINKYLSITPGTDNKYIEAQLLTSIISDCNFAINALNKEDLIKFEAFLNEFESRTHNPACARIRELSIDRRRKLL